MANIEVKAKESDKKRILSLAKKLKQARLNKGISQRVAGENINRSRYYIWRLEKAATNNRISDILELIELYECELTLLPNKMIGK